MMIWMYRIRDWFTKASPARLLVLGFFLVILTGGFLLWLPISHREGMSIGFLDALFEATSAVCVTGLTVVSPGDTFNLFGRIVMAILIQIGGMGIVLVGIGLIFLTGKKIGFKTRFLFIQAQNLARGFTGLQKLASVILKITFGIEALGVLLLWGPLCQYYDPLRAFGHACFLSVSAFNNAGFDVFPGTNSLIPFAGNVPINVIIGTLVIVGGFGFLAMIDLVRCRFRWSKLALTTKIAVFMTVTLIVIGMVLFMLTTDQTPLESWFQSVITRTAGFATYPLADFTQAGLMIFTILMFIGACPNSTGGGVKTTTIFVVLLKAFSSSAGHDEDSVFHRRISNLTFLKAFTVVLFGLMVVLGGIVLVSIAHPEFSLASVMVEVVSAFGTVGSSCGTTAELGSFAKLVIMVCMFIGRLGPVTIANMLVVGREHSAHYTEENILIG